MSRRYQPGVEGKFSLVTKLIVTRNTQVYILFICFNKPIRINLCAHWSRFASCNWEAMSRVIIFNSLVIEMMKFSADCKDLYIDKDLTNCSTSDFDWRAGKVGGVKQGWTFSC